MDKQNGLYQILKTHLISISLVYFTFFITIQILNRTTALVIALVIAIATSIVYFAYTERMHKIYAYIIGIATGFLLCGYFAEYTIHYFSSFLVYVSLSASLLVLHLLMWRFKYYKSLIFIYMFFLVITIIYAVSSFEIIIFRELLYMSIYLLILSIGAFIYVSKDNLNVERAINLSFFAAFVFIFFIILLIITEGESGELIEGFDGFEGLMPSKKKKKTP
jgi:hypothetical protein